MATFEEVGKILLNLASKYPASNFSRENLRPYAESLADIPADLLAAAADQCIAEMDGKSGDFFPSVPRLRSKALDLQLSTMGIPTAAEAWAQVQKAYQYVDGVLCSDGFRLNDACRKSGTAEYWPAIYAYKNHMETCDKCQPGGFREVYDHPAVENAVRMLGGRDGLLTDNPVADRARFVDAYREVISREVRNAGMMPSARAYIENRQKALGDGGISGLVKRLEVKE